MIETKVSKFHKIYCLVCNSMITIILIILCSLLIIGILVINALSENEEGDSEIDISHLMTDKPKPEIVESIAPDGKSYYTESILKIPKLGIEYPVLSDTSDELLKISLNRIWGPSPNTVR